MCNWWKSIRWQGLWFWKAFFSYSAKTSFNGSVHTPIKSLPFHYSRKKGAEGSLTNDLINVQHQPPIGSLPSKLNYDQSLFAKFLIITIKRTTLFKWLGLLVWKFKSIKITSCLFNEGFGILSISYLMASSTKIYAYFGRPLSLQPSSFCISITTFISLYFEN